MLYRWRNAISSYLYDLHLQLTMSQSDYKNYMHLKRIEMAYRSNLGFYNQIKDKKVDLKRSLGSLSSDIDYILEQLDGVRGGDFVKTFKKELSNKVVVLSNNIDAQLKMVSE